ncbi:alpha/beta fold hydrolase [Rhodococcus sp. NPDC057014]|uniref:alpha/beta fold hydrolase n=1 Tax=Rhodococcus sp. NPDC057014 TaxID=3346000 RepID=UPI0036318941
MTAVHTDEVINADVELDTGVRLSYARCGAGEPLVLLPGTGSDRRFWDRQLPVFAQRYDVIVVDNRGSGESDVPGDTSLYSSEIMADDAAALIRALGFDRAHVAGHSLGASIGQQLAIRHPDVVHSLQLHATKARNDEWLRRAFGYTSRYALERGDRKVAFRITMMWMLSAEYLDTRQPAEVADMVNRCYIENPNVERNATGMLGHLEANAKHDSLAGLALIAAPTLVTAGANDAMIPARYSELVARSISTASYKLFTGPRSSHAYPWEMSEEFNAATLAFLREHPMNGDRHV